MYFEKIYGSRKEDLMKYFIVTKFIEIAREQ